MNRVTLIGNLTADPQLETRGDTKVCDLRIAVDNAGGKDEAGYFDVTTFDKQAEACAAHLSKGRQVAVDGRLAYSQWETEDGQKRSRVKVVGSVQFLGGKPSKDGEPEPEPAGVGASSDDVPEF